MSLRNRWTSIWSAPYRTPAAVPESGTIETEPIVGYRSWIYSESPEGVPFLRSVTKDYQWLPFEPSHGDISGDGGIYAFKTPDEAWRYAVPRSISGEVYLWGMVLEHAEGFRAEHAYPKELWVGKDFDATMIVRLEETYGVPVVIKEAPTPPVQPPMNFRPAAHSSLSAITSTLAEFVVDTVYDRETICGSRMHLFSVPVGQMSYGIDGIPAMKTFNRTNMYQCACMPAPNRFLIKSLRCAFFEADGSLVPVTDPIYWDATLELSICMKTYWRSPCAHVCDPANLLAATDWSKIPHEERLLLIDRLRSSNSLVSDSVNFGGLILPGIDGVMIEQQQSFQVKIDGAEKWQGRREVMVALEGISGRAVM